MDVGLGSPGLYLLLCGGLAAVAGKALARRDGPAALATGIAAVVAGQAAGLSAHVLAVAWTVVAIGLISAAGSVALRWLLGARGSFTAGLVIFCTVLGGLATQRRTVPGLQAGPLTMGTMVQQQLAPLVAWRVTG